MNTHQAKLNSHQSKKKSYLWVLSVAVKDEVLVGFGFVGLPGWGVKVCLATLKICLTFEIHNSQLFSLIRRLEW